MALQAKYNKEQADYSQQLALDMWNATNYESQVEHMKAAGLNPALLYSKGGAGVSSGVRIPLGPGGGVFGFGTSTCNHIISIK